MPRPPISRADAAARGLKRFFTGAPCVHGHVAERYVKGCACCECQALHQRRLREADPEGVAAYHRAWNAANADRRRASRRAWREANRERVSASWRAWRAARRAQEGERDA